MSSVAEFLLRWVRTACMRSFGDGSANMLKSFWTSEGMVGSTGTGSVCRFLLKDETCAASCRTAGLLVT